jgi:outer membrane protein assembly factor BamD
MNKNILYSVILILTLFSCSGFEKIRKSNDNNLKYRMAFFFYSKGDFVKAATLFDDIVNVYRATNKADSVSYFQAMSYYKQGDSIMAAHYFGTFAQNFMYSPFAQEAEYMEAYCYYKQSPRAALDQTITGQALHALTTYLRNYPASPHNKDIRNYIVELEDKLVEKSRLTAKLYYDMGYYKSAIIALNNSLDDYPNTKYKEDLMWMILDSNFKLAEKSVPSKQKERYQAALDEYYTFVSQFPESKYTDNAKEIYNIAEKFVTK